MAQLLVLTQGEKEWFGKDPDNDYRNVVNGQNDETFLQYHSKIVRVFASGERHRCECVNRCCTAQCYQASCYHEEHIAEGSYCKTLWRYMADNYDRNGLQGHLQSVCQDHGDGSLEKDCAFAPESLKG